jgi:hypothetical protein
MKTVFYTVVTASGRGFDIEFPLHPHTRSESGVSETVTDLLAALSDALTVRQDLSDGDVIQALAMTLAIRARMLDEKFDTMDELVYELLKTAMQAVHTAQPYTTSRA